MVGSTPPPLLLASSSRYRREALARLGIPFQHRAPELDESPLEGESPDTQVCRLAEAKARALADGTHLVLGSDQVAVVDGRVLGKPGTEARAREQLEGCSGRTVEFLTAVCLVGPDETRCDIHLDRTRVRFRRLDADTIARYVERERPLDCAGAFKCEGLGIALFEAVDNVDPTALVGLPLIATAAMLRDAGLDIP